MATGGASAGTAYGCGGRVPVTEKSTERMAVSAQQQHQGVDTKLQCAVSGMRGWRPTMEDQHIMQVALCNELPDHCLFAIFDGHGGGLTSQFLQQKFRHTLLERPSLQQYIASRPRSRSDVRGIKLLQTALQQTFEHLDHELEGLQNQVNHIMARRHEFRQFQLQQQQQQTPAVGHGSSSPTPESLSSHFIPPPPTERSGSTAIVVLLTPTHIITANTGDSRAILRRHGRVVPLSFDHKPNDVPEHRRILRANGMVRNRRVDGDLAVSRAFGDFSYKSSCNQNDRSLRKVIVTPDFTVYPRDASGDEFLVLACDGIWDVATNQECSEYVQNMLTNGETDLGYICEDALDLCLKRKSRDNMTMMIVSLPGIQIDVSSRATLQNAFWRTHRQIQSLGSSLQNVKGVCEAATREAALKLQAVVAKPILTAY